MKLLNRLAAADRDFCIMIHKQSGRKYPDLFFLFITRMADGWFYLVMMLFLLLFSFETIVAAGIPVLKGFLINFVFFKVLKHMIKRERPFVLLDDVISLVPPPDKFSFPSGHTSHAVMFSVITGYFFPGLYPLTLIFAVFVGISRIYNGVHYPADVLAGWVLGLVCGEIALA